MSGKAKQGDSKKKDDIVELEQQFILRLPPGQAMALNHEIDNGNYLKDNLFIDLTPENRWGHVRYGGEVINAKLVDLPCILETLKSTDNKTFYKTADICQMLIASNDMEPSDDEPDSPKKKKEKEKKYQYLHGIVPPLKNVRKRRFRKTLRKKPIDLVSIEKEVKRLLRMDLEAFEVKTEEIADDAAGEGSGGADAKMDSGAAGDMQLDEEKLFGEISSSEDEADINIDDESDGEQDRVTPTMPQFRPGSEVEGAMADADDEDDDIIIDKILSMKQQLAAVETRIAEQEMEIRQMDNADLRRRFEAVLDELYAEKSDLTQEILRLENI